MPRSGPLQPGNVPRPKKRGRIAATPLIHSLTIRSKRSQVDRCLLATTVEFEFEADALAFVEA